MSDKRISAPKGARKAGGARSTSKDAPKPKRRASGAQRAAGAGREPDQNTPTGAPPDPSVSMLRAGAARPLPTGDDQDAPLGEALIAARKLYDEPRWPLELAWAALNATSEASLLDSLARDDDWRHHGRVFLAQGVPWRPGAPDLMTLLRRGDLDLYVTRDDGRERIAGADSYKLDGLGLFERRGDDGPDSLHLAPLAPHRAPFGPEKGGTAKDELTVLRVDRDQVLALCPWFGEPVTPPVGESIAAQSTDYPTTRQALRDARHQDEIARAFILDVRGEASEGPGAPTLHKVLAVAWERFKSEGLVSNGAGAPSLSTFTRELRKRKHKRSARHD